MKKILSILIFLTMNGCVHTKVTRIGRHERLIHVTSPITSSKHRLYFHLVRKAKLLKCDAIRVLEIVDNSHATGVCITRP
jgi:hypothetical protein